MSAAEVSVAAGSSDAFLHRRNSFQRRHPGVAVNDWLTVCLEVENIQAMPSDGFVANSNVIENGIRKEARLGQRAISSIFNSSTRRTQGMQIEPGVSETIAVGTSRAVDPDPDSFVHDTYSEQVDDRIARDGRIQVGEHACTNRPMAYATRNPSLGRLSDIMKRARFLTPEFRITVVQPGLSQSGASDGQLDLLATTELYLKETHGIPLRVIGAV